MPEELDEFTPVKAVKAQKKLKLGISGPSNSGKTDGALSLATLFGSVDDAKKKPKILVIDTENRSASLYADRYDFETIVLKAPYTPERYKKAMYQAVKGGFDWMIVDTISHEWSGEGGILRQKEKLDMQPGSNSYTNWAKVTPDHESFIEFIKQIPVHGIFTMRSKQAYVLETDGRGKQRPRKLGMEPVQRDGVDYEFDLMFDLDMQHNAVVMKNRTTLFSDEMVRNSTDLDFNANGFPQLNLRRPEIAQMIRKWLESGVKVAEIEWTPDLGTVHVSAKGDVAQMQTAPQQQPRPIRAQAPALIHAGQKAVFWTELRKAEKTDEDVRRWLWDRFKISTSGEIPAECFVEAMEWAKNPLTTLKQIAPGEEKARATAKVLGVSEADLQYELATCRGDWEQVYVILSQRQEAEDVAVEAMKAEQATQGKVHTEPKRRKAS